MYWYNYNFVDNVGDYTFYWANTSASTGVTATHYYMIYNEAQLFNTYVYKMYGCSIRCVKD